MSDTETIYTLYPIFAGTPDLRLVLGDAKDRARVTAELEDRFKSWGDDVTVRGTYSTVGFRPDADLLLWLVARSAEDLQQAVVEFRRTELGDALEMTWSFMGVVKPAEFSPDHAPAFVKGDPPQPYLCVYPFVRTPEWYLLPAEERSELLRTHGAAGREFPQVAGNTTMAFGLGDWEWILAFESPELDAIVDVIRRLRETKARLYAKEEVPFITGIRKSAADAIDDLG
jgi:peroxiredoxin